MARSSNDARRARWNLVWQFIHVRFLDGLPTTASTISESLGLTLQQVWWTLKDLRAAGRIQESGMTSGKDLLGDAYAEWLAITDTGKQLELRLAYAAEGQ